MERKGIKDEGAKGCFILYIKAFCFSVPFCSDFYKSNSFKNRIKKVDDPNEYVTRAYAFFGFLIDMFCWEQTEQIKYDFSVQFMPVFNWLKNFHGSEQNRTEMNRASVILKNT